MEGITKPGLEANGPAALGAVIAEILNPSRPAGTFAAEIKTLRALLSRESGFTINYQRVCDGESRLPSGLAISPAQAAMCLDEVARSVTFIRGVRQAIREQGASDKTSSPVHVLYAGCGPFAMLAVAQMAVFSPEEVVFTLMDIHETSLEAARRLIGALGFDAFVAEYLYADAATYRLPSYARPDIILSETMNVALGKEPQVTVFRNLATQAPEALLIPARVTVSAALMNPGEEYSNDSRRRESWRDPAQERIDLGWVFELSRNAVDDWRADERQMLPAGIVEVPATFPKCYEVMLRTKVTVYKDHILHDSESSLTIPQRLPVENIIRGGETLHFNYRLGRQPGLECEVMPTPRSISFADPATGKIADFLWDIGLHIEQRTLPADCETPGIGVEYGSLIVDETQLQRPGDLLFTAGHLAITRPALRNSMPQLLANKENDMPAMAWAYAAAKHLELDPALVFYQGGYNGWSQTILDNFGKGHYFGVPVLVWLGLTRDPALAPVAGIQPYPAMARWLVDQQ